MYRIILFLLLYSVSVLSQQWIEVSSPVTVNLNKVFFIDSAKGWACGDSGSIIFTSDMGNSWSKQNSGINTDITTIFFVDSLYGYALSKDYLITGAIFLTTTDGGTTWNNQIFHDSLIKSAVYHLNRDTGFLAGWQGEIYRTSDAGNKWELMNIDTASGFGGWPIHNLFFFDSLLGFATGGSFDRAGVIWKTSDGGLNWIAQGVSAEPIFDIIRLDSLRLLAVGGERDWGFNTPLMRSSDLGETWMYDTLSQWHIGLQFAKRKLDEIYIVLDGSVEYFVSRDTGATWQPRFFQNNITMNSMVFKDTIHGYAVGEYGKILLFNPNFVDVKDEEINIPDDFTMDVYPNPFNSYINIQYNLPVKGSPIFNLYNTLGELIFSENVGEQTTGQYKKLLNASGLSSGIYFLTMNILDRVLTNKIVLMK